MDQKSDPNFVMDVEPDDDEFSLIEIANTILRQWRVVLVLPILLALAVGLRTYSKDRMYAASASFFPQQAEGGRSGGAAALAQQFGVNLGSDGPTQSPQFYVDLLHSRALLRKVVESKYRVVGPEGTARSVTLTEYYRRKDGTGPARTWLQAVDIVRQNISPSIARQTGVVRITVTAPQPALSEQIAERLLDLLNAFNMEMLQNRAEQENRFVGERLAEAQAKVFTAEAALQNFQRQNRQFQNSPELLFEHDRLQRQVDTQQEVYTSLLRSQEQTRIDAMRDTPLITVIDYPAGTAEPQGRGTVSRALVAFVFGLGLAVVIAFISESTRRGKESEDAGHREFQRLARQVWSDLRRPSRWFRRPESSVPTGTG